MISDMKKILIVEDELSYLKLLHDQLSKNEFEVLEAQDGHEGLAIAELKHPDLILLDIRLPNMNGMTMLDQMRKSNWGKSVKVIILTNLEPDDKILKKVLEDKPDLYLVKSDIQLSELITKIKSVLN